MLFRSRHQLSNITSSYPKLELEPDDMLYGDKDMSRPIEPREVRKLEENAKVVGALEDLFSNRCVTIHFIGLSPLKQLYQT